MSGDVHVRICERLGEEFGEKVRSSDHFLATVLRGRKQFVKGVQSDLGEIIGE